MAADSGHKFEIRYKVAGEGKSRSPFKHYTLILEFDRRLPDLRLGQRADRRPTVNLNGINASTPTAALLANPVVILASSPTSINLTVGHDGFVENNIPTIFQAEVLSPTQIGITEIGGFEPPLDKVGTFENSSSEIDISKSSLPKVGISEVSPFHETTIKHSVSQINASKLGKAEIGFSETTPIKMGIGEVGFLVDTLKDLTVPKASKTPSSKISISPSVLSNQFLSIHDSTPQIINNRRWWI